MENGYVYVRKEKIKRGRGRKAYIYYLTEKGEAFLKALEEGQSIRQAQVLEKAVGEEGIKRPLEIKEHKKSIYITPFREQRSGLGVVGNSNRSEILRERVKGTENITNEGRGSKRELKLVLEDLSNRKEQEKAKRIQRLIKAREIYVETWVAFRKAKRLLEEEGVYVADPRIDEGGLDGRKLMKLIRYLLTNEVKTLNLAGWGRYARHLLRVLRKIGLVDQSVKLILPIDPDPENLEKEALLKLGLSQEEVNEYLKLSEEGKLEFLERKNLLEDFQKAMDEVMSGKVEEEFEDEDWDKHLDVQTDDEDEIPFS